MNNILPLFCINCWKLGVIACSRFCIAQISTGNKYSGCLQFTWQTWRLFTFWVNGKQNWERVNFVPESRLPFAQISSIYRKAAAKAWNRYQWWLWRNVTRIAGTFISKKQDYLLGVSLLPEYFTETTRKVLFHLFFNRIFQKLFVNDKQPVYLISDLFSTDFFFCSFLTFVIFFIYVLAISTYLLKIYIPRVFLSRVS